MAQVTADVTEVQHTVELTETEFMNLENGNGVVLQLDDVRDEYNLSCDPEIIISPNASRNMSEVSGVLIWASPAVERGRESSFPLPDGDTLTIVMPEN